MTIEQLEAERRESRGKVMLRRIGEPSVRVLVSMDDCGIRAGARPVLSALAAEAQKLELPGVLVAATGCVGLCPMEPVVEVFEEGRKTTYVHMTAEKAARVAKEHLAGGRVVAEYTIDSNS